MRFKYFMQITEEGQSSDNGLMGFPVASSVRKPSDGQPFKDVLGSVSGQTPKGNTGGGMGSKPMFMKKMKKP
jgi:hypothetical protein